MVAMACACSRMGACRGPKVGSCGRTLCPGPTRGAVPRRVCSPGRMQLLILLSLLLIMQCRRRPARIVIVPARVGQVLVLLLSCIESLAVPGMAPAHLVLALRCRPPHGWPESIRNAAAHRRVRHRGRLCRSWHRLEFSPVCRSSSV
eukprot:scaffold77000_cov45-Prasinocladus_malaysianus.AAC.2